MEIIEWLLDSQEIREWEDHNDKRAPFFAFIKIVWDFNSNALQAGNIN